jgi:hypothetical protein
MTIKNKNLLTAFLIIACFIQALEAYGQNDDLSGNQDYNYRDKLFIVTDRDIYITGEQVWIKIFKTNGLTGMPSDISKVICVELLDGQNNPLNQFRVRCDGASGNGMFRLSDTLSSGNYLIRAYTSWMENFTPGLFSYRMITVINPFRDPGSLTAPVSENAGENGSLSGKHEENTAAAATENDINVTITPERIKYGTRDSVKISISVYGAEMKPVKADLSLSVTKHFLTVTGRERNIESRPDTSYVRNTLSSPLHLPELEGELIRGVIYNKATNEPLANTDISFSIVGKTARCQFGRTNPEGEFFFVASDLTGMNEIVIQPLSPDISGSYVELVQSFSGSFSDFIIPHFDLDTALAENINNAVISMQVKNVYEQAVEKSIDSVVYRIPDFFGDPSRVIKLADFIELKDIREVVKELLPDVSLIRKNGRAALKVVSSNIYQLFEDPALVIFDGVPVNDIDALMKANAKDLESIKITNTRYFYSDYIFDGIISFSSKAGNLGSLEYGNSVFRQVYEGCQKPERFYSPDYRSPGLKRIPDFRNTLFWKPDIMTAEDGTATVEFFTSDEATEYLITVNGLTSDGRKILFTAPLTVN